MTTARVIGAGLSGLGAAWRLADTGVKVDVFESATAAGGLIGTTRTGWGPAEHAANAFVWTDGIEEWFRRLDIPPVFALDTSRRRFIYRNGRPRRWPLSALETLRTVARVGTAVATRGLGARDSETVEQWGVRVAGPAATRHLLAPALQGIYAAPLDRLAARAVFGHRKQRKVRMVAPSGGMGEFIARLRTVLEQRGVRIHLGRPITALDPDTPTWICTSAPAAARLLQPHAPAAAALVSRVELAALATATAFYDPHPGDVHGFGVLFPRDEGIHALGVLFNTDIFPGRGSHRSETWIYGGATPGALPPKSELPALLHADRLVLTGRDQPPIGTHIAYWPEAFPIYDQAIIDLATLDQHLPPWLHVKGNYLGKRGVSDLI
jgi:oxygen-dependent protoporphyrinogen oxidase